MNMDDCNPKSFNNEILSDSNNNQVNYDNVRLNVNNNNERNNAVPETRPVIDNTTSSARRLFENKKQLFAKKARVDNCKSQQKSSLKNLFKQKLCRCPVCHPLNMVKGKIAGKNYFKLPFANFKIPRFDHLFDLSFSFNSNRRKGEVCGACGGKKTITDVNDDAAKYKQVAEKVNENAEKIMEAEAKLGLGGTRTTIIQGSDVLFVGLGFNNNKTYEVIQDGAISPSMKGGKIPQQNAVKTNAVVGKQGSIAWPQQVGNYSIKCANKFNLLAGAGGITIASPGPLTISAGIMKFVGPQITVGSSSGPLALEGESVNITGKAISITPTAGELFVKGNISNTGNVTTQGHAHFESVSFVKGSTVGTTKSTYMANANPDVTCTQAATWSIRAVAAALLDIQAYYQNILTDWKTSSFRLMSPKENRNISDRMRSLSRLCVPWEILPTGYVLPGDCDVVGAGNHGAPVYSTNPAPIPIHNFPHVHGIPEMMHNHEVMLPDMDYQNSTPDALREKTLTGAHETGAPSDPTKDTVTRYSEVRKTGVELSNASVTEGTKSAAMSVRMS